MKSIAQIQQTPEYRALTKHQQTFITTYVENGENSVEATKSAYNCKGDKSAQAYSRRIMSNKAIIRCLAVAHHDDEQQVFAEVLLAAIQSGKMNDAEQRAYALYAQLKGWFKPYVPPASHQMRSPTPKQIIDGVKPVETAKTSKRTGHLDEFDS